MSVTICPIFLTDSPSLKIPFHDFWFHILLLLYWLHLMPKIYQIPTFEKKYKEEITLNFHTNGGHISKKISYICVMLYLTCVRGFNAKIFILTVYYKKTDPKEPLIRHSTVGLVMYYSRFPFWPKIFLNCHCRFIRRRTMDKMDGWTCYNKNFGIVKRIRMSSTKK